MARQKLILDVDTGTDDAIALMLAVRHPDLELVGVTTVNGNNPVDACTDNTLRVLDLLGAEVPVHEGAVSPLLRDDFPIPRAVLHRDGSMHPRELPLPRPRSAKADGRAAEFLVETYMAATEPITLVPVGPLTNIALAIRLEPRIVERIPRTVIMGGAHELGNVTPSAEFNVWVDPDAARIVLRAGLARCRPGPARCDPSRAGVVRRLRPIARHGHAGRPGGRRHHRGPHRRVRPPPADGDRERGTGARRAGSRLSASTATWCRAGRPMSTSRRAAT